MDTSFCAVHYWGAVLRNLVDAVAVVHCLERCYCFVGAQTIVVLLVNVVKSSDLAAYFHDFVLTHGSWCWSATVLCAQNRFLTRCLRNYICWKPGISWIVDEVHNCGMAALRA